MLKIPKCFFFSNCLFSMMVLVSCQPKGEGDEEIEGDVGLELKVNFSEKAVHRNARLSGQWGTSETALSFFPFAPGEPFKVETRVCVWRVWSHLMKPLVMSYLSVTIMLFPSLSLPDGDCVRAPAVPYSGGWATVMWFFSQIDSASISHCS